MSSQSDLVVVLSKNNIDILAHETPNLSKLIHAGFHVPDGFIITSKAFAHFINENNLAIKIKDLISTVHFERSDSLMQVSNHIKKLITESQIPKHLSLEIIAEYKKMGGFFSSAYVAVGENYPDQIKGAENLINKIKHHWASRFEPKYLLHYKDNNVDYFQLKISIPIQKIIDSKYKGVLLTSIFTIDTKSKLNKKQKDAIIDLGKKLKKHFYFPQVVTWVIKNNKIYTINVNLMTNIQNSHLVLVRHGESVWNAKGLWTGWTDIELSEKGHTQARDAGKKLIYINFDLAYTSTLKRAIQTMNEIKKEKGINKILTIRNKALNERNYGELTGKNKWDVEKEFGKKQFIKWRRSWDNAPPKGESLKDVYDRVIPYYTNEILPRLKSGKNIIITAHGNSLRALVKFLENISDDNIVKVEIPVGQIIVYQVGEDGLIISKQTL